MLRHAMQPDDDPLEATRMSLGEHLEELRKRLIRGLAGIALAFAVGWFFQEPITAVVLGPLQTALANLNQRQVEKAEAYLLEHPDEPRSRFFTSDDPEDRTLLYAVDPRPMYTGVAEGFFFTVRVVFYFALFLGAPLLLYQVWQFVAAGLYPDERRGVLRYFPYSVLLFVMGVTFGYFVMLPFAMYFLIGYVPLDLVRPEIRLSEYFSLLTALSLALGAVFQLPIAMLFATRSGLVEIEGLVAFRRYFILTACVVSGILTPPDPYTMVLMAIPTILLYEIGIAVARVAARRADAQRELHAT